MIEIGLISSPRFFKRGDLGDFVENNCLHVPPIAYELAVHASSPTAEGLASLMESHPAVCSAAFGWRMSETRAAAAKLRVFLQSLTVEA